MHFGKGGAHSPPPLSLNETRVVIALRSLYDTLPMRLDNHPKSCTSANQNPPSLPAGHTTRALAGSRFPRGPLAGYVLSRRSRPSPDIRMTPLRNTAPQAQDGTAPFMQQARLDSQPQWLDRNQQLRRTASRNHHLLRRAPKHRPCFARLARCW